jgi:hypothetical protein
MLIFWLSLHIFIAANREARGPAKRRFQRKVDLIWLSTKISEMWPVCIIPYKITNSKIIYNILVLLFFFF